MVKIVSRFNEGHSVVWSITIKTMSWEDIYSNKYFPFGGIDVGSNPTAPHMT